MFLFIQSSYNGNFGVSIEKTSAASGTLDASGFCVKDILDIPGLMDIPDILELRN